ERWERAAERDRSVFARRSGAGRVSQSHDRVCFSGPLSAAAAYGAGECADPGDGGWVAAAGGDRASEVATRPRGPVRAVRPPAGGVIGPRAAAGGGGAGAAPEAGA